MHPNFFNDEIFLIYGIIFSVLCCYNEQTICLRMYECLLTNRLHGKAADLWLANS